MALSFTQLVEALDKAVALTNAAKSALDAANAAAAKASADHAKATDAARAVYEQLQGALQNVLPPPPQNFRP